MKIYISPSDQTENPYAWGNTNEGTQCHRIAKALEEAFLRVGGCEVKRNDIYSISRGISESNAWGADYHICIHTNAFNGSVMGTRMFYGQAGSNGQKACDAVLKALAPITPGTSDNSRSYPELNEVRLVSGQTVYCEVGFHDTVQEAKWIVEHTADIAEAICKGMCEHLGIKYFEKNASPAPASAESPSTNTLYRVQVGAFSIKANAEYLKSKLKAAGYDAFIVEVPK